MTDSAAQEAAPITVLLLGLTGLARHFAADFDVAAASADEDPLVHAQRILVAVSAGAEIHMAGLEARDAQLAEALAESVRLRKSVATWKGQATKARAATAKALAEAEERDPASRARRLPADPPVVDRAGRAELLELVELGDSVEIVAFEDDREILSIPPLVLKAGAAALREGGEGLVLASGQWVVMGPPPHEPAVTLTSWGLFVDGELAAWRQRPSGPLVVGKGASFDLSHDVVI